MAAAWTFTVVIDPEVGGVQVPGQLTVKFQNGANYSSFGSGDLEVLSDFSRTGHYAKAVQAGYELTLPTDVPAEGVSTDSVFGYDLTWFSRDARVTALFQGQPAGSTVLLSELVDAEPGVPVIVSAGYAAAAEASADAAAASAAAAATFDPANFAPREVGITVSPSGTAAANVTEVQAAIDAAAPLGVPVLLRGTFDIDDSITAATGSIIDGSAATITMTSDLTAAFVTAGADNVQFIGLTIHGKTTDYVDSSTVYNASAVYASGTTENVTVSDCQFLGWAGAGVHVASTVTGAVTVRGTRMTGAPDEIAAARLAAGPTAEVNYGAGVRSLSVAPIEVRGCDISEFAQGIVTAKAATDVRIIDNYIHDITSGQHGAYLSLTKGLVFTGNTITNAYDCGMKVQIADPVETESNELLISNNRISGTGGQAILLTNIETVAPDSLVPSRRFAIIGNVCTDNTRAIQVNDSQNGTIAGNVISDSRSNGAGINVEDCTGVTVLGNRIKNVHLYGMRFVNAADCLVAHNRITDAATGGVSSNNFGIQVTGTSPDLIFDGNIVTDTAGTMLYGFYFNHTGLDSLTVRNNYGVTAHASGYGARFASATAVREYRGNTFSGGTNRVLNPPTSGVGRPTRESFGSAAPTATGVGAARIGDVHWNTAPTASGTMGWVCTGNSAVGTSGTWKTFGAISA